MQLLPGVGGGDGSGPGLWSVRAAITNPTDGRRKQWTFTVSRLWRPEVRDQDVGMASCFCHWRGTPLQASLLGCRWPSACSYGLLPMDLVRGPCSNPVASMKACLLFRPCSEVLDKVQRLSRELSLACNPGPPRSVSWGPCSRGPGWCPQCGVMRAWFGRGCPPPQLGE